MRRRHPGKLPRRPRRRPRDPGRPRRGIFLLPSLFTVGNMLAGFAAVLHAFHGRLALASWLIILAGILDGLDGRVARLTGATSEFGKEYDSLADVVSFGVAPAILAYQWGFQELGRWGWAVAFLYLVAGSVRLARFNVRVAHEDRRFFTGLPIPGGAGAVALLVLLRPEVVRGSLLSTAAWLFVLLVALLMVSTVPYRSYKDFNPRERLPAAAFFVLAIVVAVIVTSPVPVMAAILGTYLVSGPAEVVFRWFSRGSQPQPETAGRTRSDDRD